ncbi:uncharacterized protein LOC121052144 [Rosa chinensis]|uniref:uncharacterized protein LOC121052144 n=1 Tax=Rosa chinensis TaxID=74649 RepID=UPI001AD908B0|nr:uncharacterized protein LOC121052144 [Rosa chinensis]
MDAAWDADLNSCGLTIVIRDPSRVIVGGSSSSTKPPLNSGLDGCSDCYSHSSSCLPFHRVNWRWVTRKANVAADHLVASMALRRVCPVDWCSNPPPSLMLILLYDVAAPP